MRKIVYVVLTKGYIMIFISSSAIRLKKTFALYEGTGKIGQKICKNYYKENETNNKIAQGPCNFIISFIFN